jgi:hypothetical protein
MNYSLFVPKSPFSLDVHGIFIPKGLERNVVARLGVQGS